MNMFIIYWLDGKFEKVEGTSIDDAFRRAGYGGGATRAIDFYEEAESPNYSWNGKDWIRSTPFPQEAKV